MRAYFNARWVALCCVAAWMPALGADAEFRAGGVSLALPGPSSDFSEVDEQL
jgi:hypothetical protein